MELEEAFLALLPHLWRNYAMAEDRELAADAQRLKQELRSVFKEVELATQEP
jgi:hypothetical protein